MSGKAIRETVGFLAVVAGLVFVGMEIQQNNRLARAETRQAIVDDSFQILLTQVAHPDLNRQAREWSDAAAGDELDCEDRYAEQCVFMFVQLRHHENIFIQVAEGVDWPRVEFLHLRLALALALRRLGARKPRPPPHELRRRLPSARHRS